MKRFKRLIIIFLTTFVFSNFVLAVDKVVYLDVDKVMALSKAGKSLKTQLDKIHKSNISNFKNGYYSIKIKVGEFIKVKSFIKN